MYLSLEFTVNVDKKETHVEYSYHYITVCLMEMLWSIQSLAFTKHEIAKSVLFLF